MVTRGLLRFIHIVALYCLWDIFTADSYVILVLRLISGWLVHSRILLTSAMCFNVLRTRIWTQTRTRNVWYGKRFTYRVPRWRVEIVEPNCIVDASFRTEVKPMLFHGPCIVQCSCEKASYNVKQNYVVTDNFPTPHLCFNRT